VSGPANNVNEGVFRIQTPEGIVQFTDRATYEAYLAKLKAAGAIQ
jgi:hypothetical protein